MERGEEMSRYLIVAHQTAADPELIDKLREIAGRDAAAEFVLLVPATPARHLLTWVESEGTGNDAVIARDRAVDALRVMRGAGLAMIDGFVGASDPLRAIEEEHRNSKTPYAVTIISTLPAGISSWLKRDLPNQVRHRLGVEVIHVVVRQKPVRKPAPPSAVAVNSDPAPDMDDVQPLDLRGLAASIGRELYCQDGAVGQVKEVLYDYVTREPVWIGVASRPLPFRTLLVPARSARVLEGRLIVPLKKDLVHSQPPVDVGEGIPSITDEAHIYQHFGLTVSEMHDLRVLRNQQDLPDSTRYYQNILESERAEARGPSQ
jgi:hypothetical protein